MPPLPPESVDYLRMNLDLTPTEYMDTSRDMYETAMAYQCARANGTNDARDEERQRQEADQKRAAHEARAAAQNKRLLGLL